MTMLQRWTVAFLLILCLSLSCRDRAKHTFSVSVPYELTTLDPHASDKVGNFFIHANLYEPLVRTDFNMKVQPCLAESWETPDPYTWIFHLRPGVRFQSGKIFGAEDVAYSFQRLMNDESLELRTHLRDVAEIRVVDPVTVRVRTRSPLIVFLNMLSFVLMVPAGSTTAGLAVQPDGTGPYRLDAAVPGHDVQIIRNRDYWGEEPEIDRVLFRMGRSTEEAIQDLVTGKSQLIHNNSKQLETAISSSTQYEILFRDSLMLKYLGLDVARDVSPYCSVTPNPFKNKLVRQAIHSAVDRSRLLHHLPRYGVPGTQPVPPFVFGFNPQIATGSYRLDHAKKLLSQAGLPDGFEVTLHVRKILEDSAVPLKEELSLAGIRLNLKVLSDAEFFDAVSRRDASAFLNRYGCLTGDASELVDALHTTDSIRKYGNRNYGSYSNREVDRILEENVGIQDPESRLVSLQRAMSLLMDDLPWIPLYFDQEVYAIDRTYSWQPRYDGLILCQEVGYR